MLSHACGAHFLDLSMTEDMCLEASCRERNSRRQLLQLHMLLLLLMYFCAAQLLVGRPENSSDLRRLVQSVMQRRRCFTTSFFCPLVK